MRKFGYSTGALALGDFRRALAILHAKPLEAVELSALRADELPSLVDALDSLDLQQYEYISVHAPSRYQPEDEPVIVDLLRSVARRGWPIVLHPDAIVDAARWRPFGNLLCIENMDKRKPIGRTVAELEHVFEQLPDASFCFDIGHARQVDSSMTGAYFLLKQYGPRLRQVHLSEVNTASRHDALSFVSILAFQEVAHWIPESVPVILETPVPPERIESEVEQARIALPLGQPAVAG